eukprot:jgi/Chrzof1/9883/Cz04g19170.t1
MTWLHGLQTAASNSGRAPAHPFHGLSHGISSQGLSWQGVSPAVSSSMAMGLGMMVATDAAGLGAKRSWGKAFSMPDVGAMNGFPSSAPPPISTTGATAALLSDPSTAQWQLLQLLTQGAALGAAAAPGSVLAAAQHQLITGQQAALHQGSLATYPAAAALPTAQTNSPDLLAYLQTVQFLQQQQQQQQQLLSYTSDTSTILDMQHIASLAAAAAGGSGSPAAAVGLVSSGMLHTTTPPTAVASNHQQMMDLPWIRRLNQAGQTVHAATTTGLPSATVPTGLKAGLAFSQVQPLPGHKTLTHSLSGDKLASAASAPAATHSDPGARRSRLSHPTLTRSHCRSSSTGGGAAVTVASVRDNTHGCKQHGKSLLSAASAPGSVGGSAGFDLAQLGSQLPAELQARLRKKIRIIQPISAAWEQEALLQRHADSTRGAVEVDVKGGDASAGGVAIEQGGGGGDVVGSQQPGLGSEMEQALPKRHGSLSAAAAALAAEDMQLPQQHTAVETGTGSTAVAPADGAPRCGDVVVEKQEPKESSPEAQDSCLPLAGDAVATAREVSPEQGESPDDVLNGPANNKQQVHAHRMATAPATQATDGGFKLPPANSCVNSRHTPITKQSSATQPSVHVSESSSRLNTIMNSAIASCNATPAAEVACAAASPAVQVADRQQHGSAIVNSMVNSNTATDTNTNAAAMMSHQLSAPSVNAGGSSGGSGGSGSGNLDASGVLDCAGAHAEAPPQELDVAVQQTLTAAAAAAAAAAAVAAQAAGTVAAGTSVLPGSNMAPLNTMSAGAVAGNAANNLCSRFDVRGASNEGMGLSDVHGQLGLLYRWYVTNRALYIEQAQQLLHVMELQSQQLATGQTSRDSPLLRAFEKALEIMKTSTAVELQL